MVLDTPKDYLTPVPSRGSPNGKYMEVTHGPEEVNLGKGTPVIEDGREKRRQEKSQRKVPPVSTVPWKRKPWGVSPWA